MKILTLSLILISTLSSLYAQRLGDIANVIGVRENQLIGYGLVVGLNGTGDGSSSQFTLRSLSNLLQTVNVKIDPADIKSKNVATVDREHSVVDQIISILRNGDVENQGLRICQESLNLETSQTTDGNTVPADCCVRGVGTTHAEQCLGSWQVHD